MRTMLLGALAAATALTGCAGDGYDHPGYASGNNYRQYDYNRPDPQYNGYYADRYYRDGPNYRERRLGRNDRVYRGQNGQYYCRRNDGTTGLIVGGVGGAVLGGIIAPGGSSTLGALLGAAGGALAGQAIDKDGARCK
ncbi:hypothetical protein [Sphingomonas paeninsulae]|jgi:hypothetical protein|uniref:hypothetical protein n=1 Tax=Sphingomonas paeninsulae TaxID=2319844 RepID=UPI001969902F|nr:hypothetical protein [Sphingomonas paeninsulae]